MDKKKALSLVAVAVIAIVGMGAAYTLMSSPETSGTEVSPAAGVETPAVDYTPEAPVAAAEDNVLPEEVAASQEATTEETAPAGDVAIDVKKALAERMIGSDSAPVTVREFASLSCPHCAHFHKENYEKLKAEYIDTGKIKFIFVDFPLNAPALDAAMIARCLPQERYFPFIKFLFDNQEKWVFQENVRNALKQNAKLVGASDEMLEACLNNAELKKGLVDNMAAMTDKYKVESTPTFVLNEAETLKGGMEYSVIKKEIDSLLSTAGEKAAE